MNIHKTYYICISTCVVDKMLTNCSDIIFLPLFNVIIHIQLVTFLSPRPFSPLSQQQFLPASPRLLPGSAVICIVSFIHKLNT